MLAPRAVRHPWKVEVAGGDATRPDVRAAAPEREIAQPVAEDARRDDDRQEPGETEACEGGAGYLELLSGLPDTPSRARMAASRAESSIFVTKFEIASPC